MFVCEDYWLRWLRFEEAQRPSAHDYGFIDDGCCNEENRRRQAIQDIKRENMHTSYTLPRGGRQIGV